MEFQHTPFNVTIFSCKANKIKNEMGNLFGATTWNLLDIIWKSLRLHSESVDQRTTKRVQVRIFKFILVKFKMFIL